MMDGNKTIYFMVYTLGAPYSLRNKSKSLNNFLTKLPVAHHLSRLLRVADIPVAH
jgi:hypothetical protein